MEGLWVEILLNVIFYTRVARFWARLIGKNIRYINKRKRASGGSELHDDKIRMGLTV